MSRTGRRTEALRLGADVRGEYRRLVRAIRRERAG
jgi:hypothetical protein